jgi:HNH endonuclease
VVEKDCVKCGDRHHHSGHVCNRCQRVERKCVTCGKVFIGARTRCSSCTTTPRSCVTCQKIFRSPGNRECGVCRKRARKCAACDRPIVSTERRCIACRRPGRVCATCNRPFTGRNSRCSTCQGKDRDCVGCGNRFRGSAQRCRRCRSVQRQCTSCGVTIVSTESLCGSCRCIQRSCQGCGRQFSGMGHFCSPCQNTDRTCVGCGREFSGAKTRCNTCYWHSTPAPERSAQSRRAKGRRRALRLAAEVAGPVSARAYAAILAESGCVYCGDPAKHVDHVRPLARGGWEHPCNLVPACATCNISKGGRLLTEWRPARVEHGVVQSRKVAAEWNRLLSDGEVSAHDSWNRGTLLCGEPESGVTEDAAEKFSDELSSPLSELDLPGRQPGR